MPRTYGGIIIYLFSLVVTGTGFWTTAAPPSSGFLVFSIVLALLSATLFIGALQATRDQKLTVLGATDVPSHLVQHGPYAWCRHPFYTSYITNFLAAALLAPTSGLGWLALSMIGLMYYSQARSEEVKFKSSNLEKQYKEYCSKTGMLFPRLGR